MSGILSKTIDMDDLKKPFLKFEGEVTQVVIALG